MEEIKNPHGEDEMEGGDSEDAEEEDEEEEEELGSSPLGDHGSLIMALASTNVVPYEGLASPLRLTASAGKPLTLKRGRGRPAGRSEPKLKKPLGLKLKRWKGGVLVPQDKSPRHSMDGEDIGMSPAHSSEPSTPGGATPLPSDDKLPAPPPPDDASPYFTETWPGKVCVLCNLGERSQLGQGEMLRLACQEGFVPQRATAPVAEPGDTTGPDKSPRTPALSCRRQKNWAKCRNVVLSGQEPLDELSIVGYSEEPDLISLFENAVNQWHVYIHENCALWSLGVSRPTDADFQTIGQVVVSACVRKCSHCGRLGGSVACCFNNCQRALHHPCAAASAAFQDAKSYSLVCNLHLDQVSLMPGLGDVTCMSCFSLGDVRNLTMCSMCGNHYHGTCVGLALALLPGVRAGWQCQDCRLCQICRQPEDSKVMLCETCDKAYHPHCLRPIVTTIPKYGWKCKCCRVCSDCGSRTPGAGQSSRWHAHYTVCDSCYQQRNKGFSCPLCRRAYRAAAYREMVQCGKCKRFVHGTCDPEADLVTYQQRKEATPEYEYICLNCKSDKKRKDSIEELGLDSNMSASQESLIMDEFDFDCEREGFGMGKGKPFCASKIAKKKLGLGFGRGKLGKMSGITSALYQKKQQRFSEFGRKRMPKAKMRGIFGVPGLGLQKPQPDASKDKDDDTSENKLVLCSAKDKFVLSQDLCVMCGALGTDQEGCLIACAQCGQCYHPYCASVKVTKVILQKGWRCLDCTVCEGCGQRNDEARLLLCDDCDISYHIYCMNPPLTYVPRGTWKCKWCAQCLTCGTSEPGMNCAWLKNYTECGPCGSRSACPHCVQPYNDGELIIKCIQCDRWSHCVCDNIQTEDEAEMCAEEGYRCTMCRPKDVKLPHLLVAALNRPPTPARSNSPEFTKSSEGDFYMVDGVRLSESGMYTIRSLTMEQQVQQRRRRPNQRRHGGGSSADILATIESVIAAGQGYGDDGDAEEDMPEDKSQVYREGMPVFPRADGRPPEPPEGFTIYTTETGNMMLRRKRVRNLQRLGIGGFNARLRQTRYKDRDDGDDGDGPPIEEKPRRKPQRRKPKSKLAENYPTYLQEAFFGRELLDTSKAAGQELNSSSEEEDKSSMITLSQDEFKVIEQMKAKPEPLPPKPEEDSGSDAEALKDILRLPDNLLDTELVNTIMTEGDIKAEHNLEGEERGGAGSGSKDELSDILGNFNLASMVRQTGLPNMDCKDVEEIFKGVLTEDASTGPDYQQPPTPGPPLTTSNVQPRPVMTQQQMPLHPFHPEYSSFGEENLASMEADESTGSGATIAAVLFANLTHPEWKKEFPVFIERAKQMVKVWRTLTEDQKLPYLQHARNNMRLKKAQEQDKVQTAKSAREAEQERQWKQLQAMRQQQAQQLMQDQRVQVNRVRQIGGELTTDVQTTQVTRMVAPGQYVRAPFANVPARTINPEMNRQLRDLLQRQQITRPVEEAEQVSSASQTQSVFEGGAFRHPLPPQLVRPPAPRPLPTPPPQMIIRAPRLPTADPRLQGLEARLRLRPGFSTSHVMRLAAPRNPMDPYDHLVARAPFPVGVGLNVGGDSREEIPESVTAELEQLEQLEHEGRPHNLAEVEGVNAILSDLGVEDDDELLAEMGADFNILEYADPELDKVGGGEKTNIFDVDEFEEEDSKKVSANRSEKKEVDENTKRVDKPNERAADQRGVSRGGGETVTAAVSSSTTQTTPTTPQLQPQPHPQPALLPQAAASVSFPAAFTSTPAAVSSQNIPRMQHLGQVVAQQQRLQQLQRLVRPAAPAAGPPSRLPPPYPGPPPPYPGPVQQQQEQPLLLEDLLEQEKREQEKQQQSVPVEQSSSLLSDADFERLRADVLGAPSVPNTLPGSLPVTARPAYLSTRPAGQLAQWQQGPPSVSAVDTGKNLPTRAPGQSLQWQQGSPSVPTSDTGVRVPVAQVLPSPPAPPEVIATEEDRRTQLTYETWLTAQNSAVAQQLKYYETEVQKLRKIRKVPAFRYVQVEEQWCGAGPVTQLALV